MNCMQHTRFLCPSLSPGVCSNSCPLSQWCHQNISSSVAHFFSCTQPFPASGSFCTQLALPSGGQSTGASPLVAQMVKNLLVRQETWVQSLGWEDPLEEGMATHFSILAWRIPWKEEPGGLEVAKIPYTATKISCMPQQRLKIPRAATKPRGSQIRINK